MKKEYVSERLWQEIILETRKGIDTKLSALKDLMPHPNNEAILAGIYTYILEEFGKIILEKIQQNPLSVYQLWSDLNRGNYEIYYPKLGKAYKNVHKGFENLENLGLITELDFRKLLRQGKISSNIHGAKYYRLTSFGLFNVLFRLLASVDCLIEYEHDIILQTLLYPFFEKRTIESHTSRFYFALSQYLGECCQLTLFSANEIRSTTENKEKEKKIAEFKSDLEWKAKMLAFQLVTKNDSLNRHRIRDANNRTIAYLREDRKFIKLLGSIKDDWDTRILKV